MVNQEKKNDNVVIADSWDQIFPDNEHKLDTSIQEAEFEKLVQSFVDTYTENGNFESLIWEKTNEFWKAILNKYDPDGDCRTEITLLQEGDILLKFIHPGKTYKDKIVAKVGNINHDFTGKDAELPPTDEQLFEWNRLMWEKVSHGAAEQAIAGKIASRKWIGTVKRIGNGHTPIRIGYKIYPPNILEAARELRIERPDLFIVPEA